TAADYVLWQNSLGRSGADLPADGDGNDFVNQLDYNFWKARFGKLNGIGSGATTARVPEPCAATLLLSIALTMVGIKRHRKLITANNSSCSGAVGSKTEV